MIGFARGKALSETEMTMAFIRQNSEGALDLPGRRERARLAEVGKAFWAWEECEPRQGGRKCSGSEGKDQVGMVDSQREQRKPETISEGPISHP